MIYFTLGFLSCAAIWGAVSWWNDPVTEVNRWHRADAKRQRKESTGDTGKYGQ